MIEQKAQYAGESAHFIELKDIDMLALLLILLSGRHIRAARGLLGWTQKELGKRSKVALGTLRKMENSDGPVDARTETLIRVITALEKAGVEFLDDERSGVRLKPR
jgi:transcriptional regulator with XRE-family HTH domain